MEVKDLYHQKKYSYVCFDAVGEFCATNLHIGIMAHAFFFFGTMGVEDLAMISSLSFIHAFLIVISKPHTLFKCSLFVEDVRRLLKFIVNMTSPGFASV